MQFNSLGEVEQFLQTLTPIGTSSVQGKCYLNKDTNKVYKLFNDYEDEDFNDFSAEQLLQFSDLTTETFIFPEAVLMLKDRVIGYIS